MELQLGLALLPSNDPIIKGGGLMLDLNNNNNNNFVYEAKKEVSFSCLHAPLFVSSCFKTSTPTITTAAPHTAIYDNNIKKKRSFGQAFDHNNNSVPPTLSLLSWNNQPDDDDDPKHQHNSSRFTIMVKNDGDSLVGWPPIKSWRKEMCFHNNHGVGNGCGCGGRGSNHHQHYSTFVKVKMEGVGIARKVDLSLHHSFQTLVHTLMDMFDNCHKDSNNYKLTYQDMEGDWLLAQDVPWRSFIKTVQRLKLVKRSENGSVETLGQHQI